MKTFFSARCVALLFLSMLVAQGYPPLPPAQIHGAVRGEYGYLSESKDLFLLLLVGDEEVARTPVVKAGAFGRNYELKLPLDLNPANGRYRQLAVDAKLVQREQQSFVAELNGRRVPISKVTLEESDHDLKPGSKKVINFTLGEDSDGDSLPDDWERYQAGLLGGILPEDYLTVFGRNQDQDRDGMSDYDEFVAGTFAGLFKDSFNLALDQVHKDGATELSFLAVIGKSYLIESSVDGKEWKTAQIYPVGSFDPPSAVFTADNTVYQSIVVEPSGEDESRAKFFRLKVD